MPVSPVEDSPWRAWYASPARYARPARTYFSNGTAMIAVPLRLPTSLIAPSG